MTIAPQRQRLGSDRAIHDPGRLREPPTITAIASTVESEPLDDFSAVLPSGVCPGRNLDLHRFRSGQVLILGGPLFEGHG